MSEETLFTEALEIADAAERAAFLDRVCASNADLRSRLDRLLAQHDRAGSFLGRPAAPLFSTGTQDFTAGRHGDDPRAAPSEGRVFGPYKLVEVIGEGGMGNVWLAQQQEPVKRLVALKVIRAGMDSRSVLARFESERQALALMDHPNIARVLDGGAAADGRPYFAMELVKGVPITRFCDEHHLTPRRRLELFVPVCLAVQHAHQKGIIHRDLKPSNVLVALYDGKPVPKVIDFGVAKATGQSLTDKTLVTGFGAIVGTLEYMSPEQAEVNQLDIDTRSDIYSLGVLLYELLTGSPPFSRKELEKAGMLEMLRLIREKEPSKPSTKLSTANGLPTLAANRGTEPAKLTKLLRGELDWIVMKALEKDRNRRYETANGFALDVQRYLADEAVHACPPSTGYRLRKFVRRNKGPVVATSFVLLGLLCGIAGTTIGMFRANEQRRMADDSATAERLAKLDALRAAEAEKAANDAAQRRLAQIEKGVELFASLVRGLNPKSEEQGAPPLYEQLRERASKAADALVGEAVGDVEAVARLQTLLGGTLRELGDWDKAVEVLERARATREAKLGANHPDTLNTTNDLALAYLTAGKHLKAIALSEQVRDAFLKNLGADHPDTLTVLDNLARAYSAIGKRQEAIVLFEQVRDARVKVLGADHRNTLTTMNNLAIAYHQTGRLSEAIDLYEQVRRANVKWLGADHSDTLYTLNNLACAYLDANKWPEAIDLHEQIRDVRVKKLGADHPDTLTTLNNLAMAYQTGGKLPEAIAQYQQVRSAITKKLGADHPLTLVTINNLAMTYEAAGQLSEAVPLYQQAAAGMEKLQFQHQYAGRIIANLIDALKKAKRFDEAETWQRKWLAVVKEQAGAVSTAYADQLVALGLLQLDQKKWSEAGTSLKECLALREKFQPDIWTTFNVKSLVGAAQLGQKKYADAEPLLLAGYQGMKEREAKIPPNFKNLRLGEAVERLVQLYDATNRPDESVRWRREFDQYRPKVTEPMK